jgi:hypothetical protein
VHIVGWWCCGYDGVVVMLWIWWGGCGGVGVGWMCWGGGAVDMVGWWCCECCGFQWGADVDITCPHTCPFTHACSCPRLPLPTPAHTSSHACPFARACLYTHHLSHARIAFLELLVFVVVSLFAPSHLRCTRITCPIHASPSHLPCLLSAIGLLL